LSTGGFPNPIGYQADREVIFLCLVGLFIGSLVGAMAQIVPYAFVLLSGMTVALMGWRQEGGFDVILVMIGLLIGTLFGAMAAVIPFGVAIFVGCVLAIMIWRTQGVAEGGPTSTLTMVLFIMISVGFLWSGTYQDFCNPANVPGFNACLTPGVSGYITAYQGCVNDCSITAFTFLGNSPFAYLLTGDFTGFISQFIGGFAGVPGGVAGQTVINWSSLFSILGALVTFAIGILLFILGSGIGVQINGEVLASGAGAAITPVDSGTRLYQSLGIGLILWGSVTFTLAGSTAWFGYIGFGLGNLGVVVGFGALYIMFITVFTFELYRQAKTYL
jgi:hypothetical protein